MQLLAFVFGLLFTVGLSNPVVFPKGNSAWVYDVKNGQPAMWASTIANYNNQTSGKPSTLNIIYSYGGDFEYYPDSSDPYQVYFDASAQAAANTYQKTQGVEWVVTVIDGRMDGGESWSPDFSKITPAEAQIWADNTAALYCSYSVVDGIQIDLEPFTEPYLDNLLVFLKQLSNDLTSKERNCVSTEHPNGRSLSAFMFAGAATQQVFQALGPNGYVTVSGYDLSSAPAGTVSTPQQYQTALEAAVDTIVANANLYNGSFVLGIPGAASTHEFETYQPTGKPVVQGYPQLDYVKAALSVIDAKGLLNNPRYLGTALWGFSSTMSYPPNSHNIFTPNTPFVDPDEEQYLIQNLGK
jgi:hypothetical protein